jgi:hypothetical protein
MLAEVVGVAVEAVVAVPTRHIGARHNSVAFLENGAATVEDGTAHGDDGPDVLMTADQRVLDVKFMRRPGVLLGLAAKRVFVGTADPGEVQGNHNYARLRFWNGEFANDEPAWPLHHGS